MPTESGQNTNPATTTSGKPRGNGTPDQNTPTRPLSSPTYPVPAWQPVTVSVKVPPCPEHGTNECLVYLRMDEATKTETWGCVR